MKRILLLLSVVAIMMVMLATSIAPAFAAWVGPCRAGDFEVIISRLSPPEEQVKASAKDRDGDGFVCAHRIDHGPNEGALRYYESR